MNEFIAQALLPFQLGFMQQAFIISGLIALPVALLSCLLVLKGWSLMGDAMSHSVMPGVVLAYMTGLPLSVGAFAAGLACAFATGYLKDNSRLREDTVMGVVFSGMFGLGLVLYVSAQSDVHLMHILFGNILGLSWADILESGAISLFCALAVFVYRRDLLAFIFDEQHARAIGLPVRFLHYGLLVVLSLTIVSALKAVGIILAIAMLITPGAIAYLLTQRFWVMQALAVALSLAASIIGVYASFFFDSAPAPTIVLVMAVIFVFALIHQQWRAHRTAASGLAHHARDHASVRSR